MVSTLQTGFKFSRTWPTTEAYMLMFEQTKNIKLVNIFLSVSPAIAAVTLWLQLNYLGLQNLNMALAMSLLILSIPFHGYFLLGKQALMPLPLSLKSWYYEIEEKLKQKDMPLVQNHSRVKRKQLTYMDLAVLLKTLFDDK